MASHFEEAFHGLQRKLINDLKRACPIGCTCIISQVYVVILGHHRADAIQNCKAAIAAVENAYGARCFIVSDVQFFFCSLSRSRISVSNTSSLLGAGAGAGAGAASSFFLNFMMTLSAMKIDKAIIKKSTMFCINIP